jgi:hypothetical protein
LSWGAQGLPAIVEITKKTAMLSIDAARKPNIHELAQFGLKLEREVLLEGFEFSHLMDTLIQLSLE